ncbi:MAG: sigma-70 family RNA polymerase sigma factor [Cyanobacteria bacterium REEB65]|nr:sigma-70 family RNA polymerase sigma factor [Cyanobacteria bacterium REEB65]
MPGISVPSQVSKPETQLVVRSQRGDTKAFGELVRWQQDRVFNVAFRMTGDRDIAADVTQDAFLRAFRSLPKLRQPERFGSWLLRIVNNLCLDALASRNTVSLDEILEDGDEHLPVSNMDPVDRLEGVLSDEAVAAALQRVPAVYRQVLVLRHIEDLPYEQIAEILDIPLGTVKTRLFRGRDQLRQFLMEGGITP